MGLKGYGETGWMKRKRKEKRIKNLVAQSREHSGEVLELHIGRGVEEGI